MLQTNQSIHIWTNFRNTSSQETKLSITLKPNTLPSFQFGFQAKRATFHQLHRVMDHISTSLEINKYCSGLFLNVAQAFDTIWHDGLSFKLKKIF